MSLTLLTYITVGLSFFLYITIALFYRARSASDFYVADGQVHPAINGMATAADWMSAASFISMAGLISFLGYGASVYILGWTGGYVLLAMLLAPYLRKYGHYTVPGFIGDRYYSDFARFVAVICLLFISFTYIAGQMRGVGIVFSRFLEVDILTGLIVGVGVVFFYAFLGGMKGITYTQVAQYCVLISAYMIPAFFISFQLTGIAAPQLGWISTLKDGTYVLERLNTILMDLGFDRYTTSQRSTMDMLSITMALMVGTAGLPHVIVRFFTVPSVRTARSSAGWALFFIALLYTTAASIGAMGRLNLMNTVQIGPVGSPEGNLLYDERPEWFDRWEVTGLLKFEDKNGDGRIQYYNDRNSDFAYRAMIYGWQGNELEVNRDIMVLANPEIAQLPHWVIALMAAGGIAAALSTAAGLLLVISSGISHDLFKGYLTPNMSDAQELMVGRLAIAVTVFLAGYLGYNPPGFVGEVVAFAFGLAASSLFPALFLGIFFRRINREGAVAGMISGLVFTLGYIIAYKGVFISPLIENVPENWFLGISPEGIGFVGMIVNFIVSFVVSSLTPGIPSQVDEMISRIRIPGEGRHS